MCPRRMEYQEHISYEQAHLRLKKDRGPVSRFACVECAASAQEWAYTGGCPNEAFDRKGRAYTTDQTRYEPMCVSCHRRHDRAQRDGRSLDVCPRGHEWNEENTGIRVKRGPGVGLRFCRACHRENSRQRRAQLREHDGENRLPARRDGRDILVLREDLDSLLESMETV